MGTRHNMSKTYYKVIGQKTYYKVIRQKTYYKGQVKKSIRRMPWHWEPTKDVTSCEKLWVGANIR